MDRLQPCKLTLLGYDKIARDQAHDILWLVLEHIKKVGRFWWNAHLSRRTNLGRHDETHLQIVSENVLGHF